MCFKIKLTLLLKKSFFNYFFIKILRFIINKFKIIITINHVKILNKIKILITFIIFKTYFKLLVFLYKYIF